jgi:beta-galactosidase
VLSTDHNKLSPAWDDVAQVNAMIVDAEGSLVPSATNRIIFKLEGPGTIAAVDNGHNASDESFQVNWRSALQGRCSAFVKATANSGKITVSAFSPGLREGSLKLKAVKPPKER